MRALHRRLERKLGWDPEVPAYLKVLGWAMMIQGALMFFCGLAVVLTH